MIKNYLLFGFLAIFLLTSCQDDVTTEEGEEVGSGTPANSGQTTTQPKTPAAYPVIGGENGVISEQTSKVLRIMTTNFWITEAYVKIRDKEAHSLNKGKWFKFEMDGRYTSGRWLESTGNGTWTYDPQNLLIHLDDQNDEEDQEYKVQISSDEQIQIWVGTERFEISGVQRKMVNYPQLISELQDVN